MSNEPILTKSHWFIHLYNLEGTHFHTSSIRLEPGRGGRPIKESVVDYLNLGNMSLASGRHTTDVSHTTAKVLKQAIWYGDFIFGPLVGLLLITHDRAAPSMSPWAAASIFSHLGGDLVA